MVVKNEIKGREEKECGRTARRERKGRGTETKKQK